MRFVGMGGFSKVSLGYIGLGEERYDLGWAERAELERERRARAIPRDAQFAFVMHLGRHGRFAGKVESVGSGSSRWEYSRDWKGRLVEARLNGRVVERYEYDREGRRLKDVCRAKGGMQVEYEYDAQDRLLSMRDVRFAYDDQGRLAAKDERGRITRYGYGEFGFLAHAAFPDGKLLTYERDGFGLLRRTLLDGRPQEEFVWRDGLRLASWRDIPVGRLLEFHYDGEERTPRALTVHESGLSSTCALGSDQVGTVKTVVDSSGYLIKELQYDSFGNLLEDSNPGFFFPLGFAGGVLDRHTGLIRFGWRYYMPEAGRFTAPDPARWKGGDPDLYDYCVDDPVGKVDPLGLEPEDVDEDGNKLGVSETGEYWTVKVGSAKACDRCKDMAKEYYAHEPVRPHPNCKCEYTKHEVDISWVFDGRTLAHIGGGIWPAKSGPWRNGILPNGVYKLGRVTTIEPKKGFCDSHGFCWWCKLTPLFDSGRTGLGIHPDQNLNGTDGCIGIQLNDTKGAFEYLSNNPGGYLRVK